MTVLITGAAGFIGYHTGLALLSRGESVVGVDDMNNYYDVTLKKGRLDRLRAHAGFAFKKLDIAHRDAMMALAEERPDIDRVIHLAAQAGVRYSLENPHAYSRTNMEGHLVVLEFCRKLGEGLKHLVYASSSSVYGANTEMPFSVDDRVDRPLSMYAATKKSMEMMSHCYSHLYRLPQTGLRFFTVYGPWGRPDMAAFIFVRKILAGEPIPVFNNGDMMRDFTYIDDIVAGVLGCLDKPPRDSDGGPPPCRVYNIGNHKSESLMTFINIIEESLGVKAKLDLLPMQPGDVRETYADIEATTRDFGFEPHTSIQEGLPRFVQWYRDFYGA